MTFFLVPVILTNLLLLFAGYILWSRFHSPPNANIVTALAAMVSASAAIIGLGIGGYWNAVNQRKQHTLNMLMAMRHSDVYQSHQLKILKYCPPSPIGSACIPSAMIEELNRSDPEYIQGSIVYLLNYLEFIALGVRNRDLDEKFIYYSLRGVFVGTYKKFEEYLRSELQCSCSDSSQVPKTYEHLLWYLQLIGETSCIKPHIEDALIKRWKD